MQDVLDGWAERLREELSDREWSCRKLALKVGVHPTTIERLVAGSLCPTDELKWNICWALGVRMDRFWRYPAVVPDAPRGKATTAA